MNKTILTAIGGILLATSISNSVSAHQARAAHNPRPQAFMAISPDQRPAYSPNNGLVPLHGPTNDTTSTATGGPVGGFGS